jgi:uncharacterized membrane protein HdeD (DUF308 family)
MTDYRTPATPDIASVRPGAGWGWIVAYGVVSVVLGIAALVWPVSATFAATVVIGAFFIASGLASIIAAVMSKGSQTRAYAILFGIVSVVIGGVMAFQPVTGALSITLLIAIWLGVRGAMELYWGLKFKRGRALMILLGIVNLLLAAYIVATVPWSALTLPGYILGISFLFGGITAIAAALDHKKGAPAFSA